MKTTLAFIVFIAFFTFCSSPRSSQSTGRITGDTRTEKIEYLNDNTYRLSVYAKDRTYGFEKSNPVKVGGVKASSGPRNERRYLNALLGPNGEELSYYRAGSCCHFKTPNGLMGNTGLLDHYRISWKGSRDTLSIYINMYDEGDLLIPIGLTAKDQD